MIGMGLTGGMGMGKSTVASLFSKYGIGHWDADAEVANLYGWNNVPGRVKINGFPFQAKLVPEIRAIVPEAIMVDVHERTVVSREAIRAAIARDPDLLSVLEKTIGPHLIRSLLLFIKIHDGFRIQPGIPVMFDTPLWFEPLWTPYSPGINTIHAIVADVIPNTVTVVVTCSSDVQRERCFRRPGMTKEKFDLLLSRQLSDTERIEKADYVIDTTLGLQGVEEKVVGILADISYRFE
jgi:dephospho-CoA kinase